MLGVIPVLMLATAAAASQDIDRMVNEANRLRIELKLAEAEKAYRFLLPLVDGARKAQTLNNLGAVFVQQARYTEAEGLQKEASDLYASLSDRAGRAIALGNLAETQRGLGKLDVAAESLNEAIALREAVFGPGNSVIANTWNTLGCLRLDQFRHEDALAAFTKAAKLKEDNGDASDSVYAAIVHNLGEANRQLGNHTTSEPFLLKSLEMRKQLFGEGHSETATALSTLAALYQDMGRIDEARTIASRALEIRRKALGPAHPHVAISLNNLSQLAGAAGDIETARTLVQEAVTIGDKAGIAPHVLGAFHVNLGEFHKRSGDLAAADPAFRRAIDLLEASVPESGWHADALTGLASVFTEQGKLAGAEKLLNRAIAIRQRTTSDSPRLAAAQRDLAMLFRMQRRTTEARRLEKTFR
jgi:tetratricopeptide (TPR) repeat protein